MKHEYRRRGLMTHDCQPRISNLGQQLNIGGGSETHVACATQKCRNVRHISINADSGVHGVIPLLDASLIRTFEAYIIFGSSCFALLLQVWTLLEVHHSSDSLLICGCCAAFAPRPRRNRLLPEREKGLFVSVP